MSTTARIEVNPKIMLGKPVIRGTRVPVELILRKLGEGATEEMLLEAYPRLNLGPRWLMQRILSHEETILLWPSRAEGCAFLEREHVSFDDAFAELRRLLAEELYEFEIPERLDRSTQYARLRRV